MAATDRELAESIVRAVTAFDRSLMVFAPPQSAMAAAAHDAGLRVALEVFADRAYMADGRLVSRQQPGAVVTDVRDVVARAVRLATEGSVATVNGSVLPLAADTMCIHGDTPGAGRLAAAVRKASNQQA